MTDKNKLIEELKDANPYPENIFLPIADERIREIVKLLNGNGYSTDSLYGNWGREIWNNCVNKLNELFESELAEQKSEYTDMYGRTCDPPESIATNQVTNIEQKSQRTAEEILYNNGLFTSKIKNEGWQITKNSIIKAMQEYAQQFQKPLPSDNEIKWQAALLAGVPVDDPEIYGSLYYDQYKIAIKMTNWVINNYLNK